MSIPTVATPLASLVSSPFALITDLSYPVPLFTFELCAVTSLSHPAVGTTIVHLFWQCLLLHSRVS